MKLKMLGFLFVLAATPMLNPVAAKPKPAPADGCPVVVTCTIDGEGMLVEDTYSNGIHVSKKYGHTYQGTHGPEHHYVVVQCQ